MDPRSFPNEKAAHAQLDRILASPPFANSIRSQRFLRYVVENSIRAGDEPLKEYAIAVEAFDRDASYDPAVDATVPSTSTTTRGAVDILVLLRCVIF